MVRSAEAGNANRLAAALQSGDIACDDVVVPVVPAVVAAKARAFLGWPKRIGFESDEHAGLIMAGAAFLASVTARPMMLIPRLTGLSGTRCPDLIVRGPAQSICVHLEVGATDSDAIYTYLLTRAATHVLVLPFSRSKSRADNAHLVTGYCFRSGAEQPLVSELGRRPGELTPAPVRCGPSPWAYDGSGPHE
jgi:hypothetical protein